MRVLIFSATYNEADCIEELIDGLYLNMPEADYLIIDDSSPDGTFAKLRHLKQKYPNLILVQRAKKLGVGSAHKQAFRYALDHGYDFLITMDADLSHDPKELPVMLKHLSKHDYVIGSRFAAGGELDYSGLRRALSINANKLSRILLGLKLSEVTTSFRGFQKDLLVELSAHPVNSDGYGFFVETAFLAEKNAKNPVEFPIHFYDRRGGKSKLSKILILKAVVRLCVLSAKRFVLRK